MNTYSMNSEKDNTFNPLMDTSVSILRKTSNRIRNEHGVTDLQEQFARLVAETGTLTEAYIRVYYLSQGKEFKGKPETIHGMAFRVSQKPKVQQRINHYMAQKTDRLNKELEAREDERIRQVRASEMSNEMIRSFIRNGIYELARKEDLLPQARLKAFELLGKLAGIAAFEKVAENEKDRTEAEAKQKLKELIEHLRQSGKLTTQPSKLASSLVIDHKPLESKDS